MRACSNLENQSAMSKHNSVSQTRSGLKGIILPKIIPSRVRYIKASVKKESASVVGTAKTEKLSKKKKDLTVDALIANTDARIAVKRLCKSFFGMGASFSGFFITLERNKRPSVANADSQRAMSNIAFGSMHIIKATDRASVVGPSDLCARRYMTDEIRSITPERTTEADIPVKYT